MNQQLIQKLKEWRSKKAKLECVGSYLILQNKTIEAIAEAMPKSREEFIAIKGLRDRKYEKYGQEILQIVEECSSNPPVEIEKLDQEKVISVGDYLILINSRINDMRASVKGEVTSINSRQGYLFFTIKDAEEDCLLECFMWDRDNKESGIEIIQGIEIVVHGFPSIYPKSGRFSFRTDAIQLVGEGILKKRYDELKKQLESEGLFALGRKKSLPNYPQKIGIITSKDGAVIHDFQSNIGRYGYKITLFDSRVEGVMAVKDLISAIRYFKDKPIDVLVIIRGGGSLESLQAFNNETLIREIADYPIPVICGIGHDKDVPLISMVADKAESTPTAVAKELNRTWDQAVEKIGYYESNIVNRFSSSLSDNNHTLSNYFLSLKNSFQTMVRKISAVDQLINNIFNRFRYILKSNFETTDQSAKNIVGSYSSRLTVCDNRLVNLLKSLQQYDPARQLKLGYSIIFSGKKVVKSINQLNKNDKIINKVSDGEITSSVEDVNS